jgi:hypothetical protein
MNPLLKEAMLDGCCWERRINIFEHISDQLDARMVELELVPPHLRFTGSITSGYRLLEHNYAVILKSLPEEIIPIVPLWDQVHLESFHSGYAAQLPIEQWDAVLNLTTD